MGKRNASPIKSTVIKEILNAYSIRPNEFEAVEGVSGHVYRSHILHAPKTRDYIIQIEAEKEGDLYTGRILLHHSDGSGKRTFYDIWETKGGLSWKYRNPAGTPPTDHEAIKDMQRQIDELDAELSNVKVAGRELANELDSIKRENEDLKNENKELKEKLSNIPDTPKLGRPKDAKRINGILDQIKGLKSKGLKDVEIMRQLKIPKPSFYRYKRMLSEKD